MPLFLLAPVMLQISRLNLALTPSCNGFVLRRTLLVAKRLIDRRSQRATQ